MRYHIFDEIRGFTLINMILYHLIWDLVYIYDFSLPWYTSILGSIWQNSIGYTFILLSGFCWSFGKNHLRRGIIVSLAGIVISIITFIFMYENRIIFGILTLLGACMLSMIPFEKIFKYVNNILGLIISLFLFIITKNIKVGLLGIGNFSLNLPTSIYHGYLATFLGFKEKTFFSTDYFPLIPWFFLFIFGYFLFRLWDKYSLAKKLKNVDIKPLSFIGKHSLIIYMVHQPIIYFFLLLFIKQN